MIYAKLRPLTEARAEDLDQTFQRLAGLLGDTGKTATVRCTILVGDAPRHFTLELRDRECRVHGQSMPKPDLEIVTQEKTWWEIAEGRLSPLEAFGQGRLRILGDTALGSQLLRRAGDREGAVSICEG